MLPPIVRCGTCCLLFLAAVIVCSAAPRGSPELQGDAKVEEIPSREKRNNYPSPFWWLPGHTQDNRRPYSQIHCGDPGRPQFGSSLYESVLPGSLVVHRCNPGYYLTGAKLRLCQSNGQWTPQLPQCVFVDCGDPGTPIHGTQWIGSTSFNSIVKYMCDNGFTLIGDSFRVCQSSGQWSGSLPICESVGCPHPLGPRNGGVGVKSTKVGAIASYSCNNGYELVGNETATCGQDGIWQGGPPFCKLIDCGSLSSPENGRVTFESTTFGSLAFYECDSGFTLVGEESRTCQSNSEWSGEEPFCRALECNSLPDIENGRVIISSQTVGSTARYICNPGYELIGSETRTCQSSGEWSGEEPFCILTGCDNLLPPANGRVDVTGTTVGSNATYSCDTGYELDGERVRVCQPNGEWTGLEPFCKIVDCGSLSSPENGQVVLTGTSFGSSATYSCNEGFGLVGGSVRVCGADGLWSGRAPICQPSGCEDLPAPQNGQVFLTGTSPGSIATYICNPGYRLEGTRSRICLASGEWSEEEPLCQSLQCPALADPENGVVTVTGTTVGATATYSCSDGFVLVGAATRICQLSGFWSGAEPFCRAVDCGFLDNPLYGRVSLTGTQFGDIATYSCNSGFVLQGTRVRTCQIDGTWSGESPTCTPSGCDPLDNPANGEVALTGTSAGSVAIYTCNSGFILVGVSARVCRTEGTWSGQEPFCRALDCGPLTDPQYGQVTILDTTFGSTALYICNEGFSLVGEAIRTCQENGVWSGSEPFCRPTGCGRLDPPENGRVDLTGTSVGSTATYRCNPGFQLEGASTRICLSTGEWSGSSPFCTPIVCPNLSDPEKGRVTLSGITFGSTATYSCDRGFGLVGVSTRLCQGDGTWSGVEPTCQSTLCKDLLPPANGAIETSGTQYGDTATYSCFPGYILVGDSTRTCQVNGFWSGREPFCQAVTCDLLEAPENGQISKSGTVSGSTTTYSCFPGFQLIGVAVRTCLENGQWSDSAPFCRLVDCGDLSDIPFGSVSLTGTTFGSVATYTCQPGYSVVGSLTRLCGANGEWSGQEPVCEGFICGSLDAPRNGQVSISGTSVGATATYFCFSGYTLVGDETRVCQTIGTWSGSEPFCRGVTCEVLEAPDNGRVVVSGTEAGDRATYSCLPGYELDGVAVRLCQDNGQWTFEEPLCVAINCPDLQNPLNGRVTLSGTIFGSTATYSCDVGYGIVGVGVRICQADGTWSANAPTCQVSECGNLEPPVNGNIETTGTNFWDTATYTCSPGFILVGEPTRTCEASGFWSGTPPFCSSVECAFLEPPKDGHVEFTSTSFGSIATYRCISGFEIVGDERRTCLENGQWSGTEPICRGVDCGLLIPPKVGDISFSLGTLFGSMATYSCDPPYFLMGNPTRVCLATGLWSGEEPSCEALECPELQSPANGAIEVEGRFPSSTAIYSCDPGFNLIGSRIRVCQNNGFWTGVTPLCQPSDCPSLKPPDNGDVQLSGTSIGSSATYSCSEGFNLVGDEIRTCLDSGGWSGVEPFCSSISCSPLSNPENGVVRVTGTSFGDTATYTCSPGFVLFGKGVRSCGEDGTWNGEAPSCQVVDCGSLSFPANGEVMVQETTFGFTATYTCIPGFVLFGFSARVCQITGEWSGDEPTCTRAVCTDLSDPDNGRVLLTGTSFGDTAIYSCDTGFVLSGSQTRRCMAEGQWSGSQPSCTPMDCVNLPAPANGRFVLSDGTTVGSVATYSCNPGYELVGFETRVCQSDTTWSGQEPFCELIDCGQLSPPRNGRIILSGTDFGSEAVYGCQDGFSLVGFELRTCQADGSWSGEAPRCVREEVFDCGQLSAPRNGQVVFTGTTPGSLATYSCRTGYQLAGGNEFRRCIDGSGWAGTAPRCESMECPLLPSPLNGMVMVVGNTLGSIAIYHCVEGYILTGTMVRTCELTGLWSGEEPSCSPIECGRLPNPTNGFVSETDIILGSVATYSCNQGFEVQGVATRTCQANGFWSGEAPTCESSTPLQCGDPGTPENGIRIGDDFRIGATVYYECDNGYEISGPASRVCQRDGTWSEFLPTCVLLPAPACNSNEDKVYDACLRRCSCENGDFVDCCRVRADYASMSVDERQRYIGAVIRVATDPQFQPRYEALVAKYKSSFDTFAQDSDPERSQFFPWHRYFLLEYENLLREIDCRITIPYWDWTVLPMNPYMSPVWDPDSGFGDSSRSNDSCVNNGPFRVDLFDITPSAGGGCLQRQYRMQMFPTRAIVERDLLTLPPEQFDEFHRFLQVFIHTNVRCFVGGQMCSPDAANDPAYLLHLSQVDSLLTRWQEIDEEHLNAAYTDDDTPLVLTSGLVVSQFSDNKDLPDDTRICYDETEFKTHVPHGMRFLSQALEEMTDNHDLHMECISDEDMSGMGGMSDDAANFMHKMCDSK